jgi:hypothetical protein
MAVAACGMAAAQAPPATAAGDENSATGSPAIPSANPLWGVPLRLLTVTQQRPLFSPTRRPPPPPVAVVAAPQAPPPLPQSAVPDRPQLTLVGTISSSSEGIGVFVEASTTRTIRIKTSQDYSGWTLLAVTRREAIFKRNDRQATLTFPVPGQGQPVPQTQPPQAAQAAAAPPAQPGGRPPPVALPAWLHSGDVQLAQSASAQSASPEPPGSEFTLPPSRSGNSPAAVPPPRKR